MKYLQKIKGWSGTFLLLLMMTLFAPWFANAQNSSVATPNFETGNINEFNTMQLTVNSGTTVNQYVPVYAYFVDWKLISSQFIIPATSLADMANGQITKMTFHSSTASASWGNASFKVYLVETNETTLSTLQDWMGMTQVYEGNLSIASNEMVVVFDMPFSYTGGNLLVGFNQTTIGSHGSEIYWYGVTATGASLGGSLENGTFIQRNFLPKTTFTYIPTAYPRVKPVISSITPNSVSFTWTSPSDNVTGYQYQYKTSTDAWPTDWTSLDETSTSLTINGLYATTDYDFRIKALYGENESVTTEISFTTACDYVELPMEDDLDSYAGTTSTGVNNLPQCWNYINTTTENGYKGYPLIYNQSSYSHSGNNHLRFYSYRYSYSPRDQYAILPVMENVSDLRIQFYARRYISSYDGIIIVGVMTDPTNASTFTEVETINLTSEDYEKYVVPFSGYSGSGGYIAFKMSAPSSSTTYYCGVLVDDIIVETIPNCDAPSNLAMVEHSNTSNSVDLSWTPGGGETAWKIQYKKETETTWTPFTSQVTTNPFTLTGLEPNTDYQVRVAAYCDNNNPNSISLYSDPIGFTTLCEAISDFPWSEDFDSYTSGYSTTFPTNNLPQCWSYINTTTNNNYKGCPAVTTYMNNDYYLYFVSYYLTDPQDQYAILPPMEDLNGKRITFTARLRYSNRPDSNIIVGVMTNPWDASTFVPIGATGNNLTIDKTKFKVKFTNVTGNYIALKMEAATNDNKYVIVDDITVELAPDCEEPDNLAFVEATGHTATFSWTDNGGSDAWQIYVATDNTLPEELVSENLHEVTTNPGTVSGLAPQTSYYAWVRGNCGDPVVYGAWSDPVSFTTGVACPQLINLTVSEVATTSATINWTSDGQETAWQVCVNNDEAHLVDVVNNTYTIPGLTPATTYTVKVRANCGGEDGYSDWSNPKYFTTEVACPEQIDFTVSDIASTYATLNWTSYGQETAWQICLNDDEAHLIDVTNNSYTFTNLTPATEYTVKMRANCGIVDGYSDWTYEQWFTTDFCDPEYKCNISYTANGFTGWDEVTIAIMDDETEIAWLTMNEGSGELALCPGDYSIVWYGDCEGGSFTIYGSDGNELLSVAECYELEYEQVLGSFVHVCEGVCFPPKNVDVWARATSATMTWDQGGDEEQWKLSWSVDNSWTEPEIVNESSYDFDNLTPGATYKARVKAVCGTDNESGWKEITFTTPLCDDACRIRYVLEDESDDGWDDNAHISVVRNSDNKEVAQLTVTANNSPLTGYLPLCPDETYRFIWVAGGEYDTECSFTIYGSDWTTIIASHEAGDGINDGEVLCSSYEHTCEGCEIFEISYDTPYIEDFNNTCWNTWGTNDPPYYYCSPSLWGGANGMASVSPGCFTSSYISLRPVKVTPTTQLTFRAWVEVWLDELIGTSTVLVSTNNGHTWIPIGQAYEGGEIVSENDEFFRHVSTKTLSLGDYAQYDFILVGFRYQGFSDNNNQISTMFVDGIRIYDPNVFEGNAKSGLWSDANNWTQGVPSEGDYVLINGDCNLDTDANLSSLKVNEGKSLTIQSGKTMITEQASTSDVNQLVIKDGGQFITNTTVLATIEKSVVGRDNGGKWNFIASPITDYQGINPANVNLMTVGDYDLYRFNQSPVLVDGIGKEWENYKAHSGEFKLFNGKGYLYSNKSDVTLSLTGDIHSGESASEGLVFAEENVNNDMSFRGWNLVGNPLTFNAYVNRSYYKMNDVGTAITAVSEYANPDNRIAPCTGIMVKAESDDDEFVIFSRGLPEGAYSNGSLNVALAHTDMRGASRGSAAFIDNAIISFNEGSKLTKFYFGDSEANIYIPQNNEELAVVCAEGMGEMPLNFKATENGSYTLSFNNEGVTFSYLHLIDNKTGSDVDLLVNPSCNFEALVTDYESRFKLVFVTNGASEDANESGFAFFSNGNWIISNEGEATLQVIDINGRVLSSETVNGSVSKAINAAPGIYILRLINGDSVKVQKVVVR